MDCVLQPADTVNYKKCSACKRTIDANSLYKTCSSCRAKAKVEREKLRLKMKEIKKMAVPFHTDARDRQYGTADASMKGYHKNRDESRKVVAGVKRKAEKSLHELEGKQREIACKMMKTCLKKTMQGHGKKPLPIVSNVESINKGQEFQNASSLYDALKSKALSSYPANKDENKFLHFHGSHTIVAVSSIDNVKRLNLVATDLRKIARLSFELDAISSLGPSGSVTYSYPCNCAGHTQAVTLPGTEKLNASGSLDQWARAKFASTASQAVPRMCGGKVYVTVLDDNTHALKILGQQIIVRVEHPNI